MKKQLRFIINPRSGTHDKTYIETLIYRYLDHQKYHYEICYTTAPKHATELSAQAAKEGYEVVVAIGGDGTVNEVGKGLLNTKSSMGIIPSGSGNGLARHLNIPTHPIKAIEIINKCNQHLIDTFTLNEDIFLGMAGIGFDAHIAWKFAQSKVRGFWTYTLLIIREHHRYKSQVYELKIDGKIYHKQAFLLSFANSSQYGYKIKIAPKASLDDGYLDVIILKDPPIYKLPSLLMRLTNGTIHKSKYYETFKCKELFLNKPNLLGHIDGEPASFNTGIHIKINPQSLQILR